MGCLSTIAGCLLVTLNVFFLLLAIAIGGLGGFIKWGTLDLFLKPLETSLGSNLLDADVKQNIIDFFNEVFSFLRQYGLAMFVVGIVLGIITLLAICGVCCQSKCLLVTYAFIVFLFLGGMTTVTVLAFLKKDDIKNAGGMELRKFIEKKYVGPAVMNFSNPATFFKGVSGAFDLLQVTTECCGITNYTDFDDAVKWKNRTFVAQIDGHSLVFYNMTIPPSCCKISQGSSSTSFSSSTAEILSCLNRANSTNSNMYKPCYATVWSYIDSVWDTVRYVIIGVTASVLLLFLAALCAMRFEKEKIDPI